MNTESPTLTPEHFKNKSLFIATPCYGGMASINYITGLTKLISFLYMYRIQFHLGLIGNESLITRARNTLTAQFMEKKYTHLFFIDADIEFNAEDVIQMLHADKDVLCGAYPTKCIPPQSVVKTVSTELVDNRFLVAHNAGTGFMMIKRGVIEKMFKSYPEFKYTLNKETQTATNIEEDLDKYAYALFDTNIEEMEDGTLNYLSEDYLFCRRWQKLGGQILIEPKIKLNHVGTHVFKAEKLEINPQD